MRGGAAPPPLPRDKMKGYSSKATSSNGYNNHNHHNGHYQQPGQHQQQQQHQRQQLLQRHRLSDADQHFATSFEQVDDNILNGDDNQEIDNFQPVHYDQRFSTSFKKSPLHIDDKKHKYTIQQNNGMSQQNNNINNNNGMHHNDLSNYSRSSASDSQQPQQQQQQNVSVPPPPNQPPPAAIVKKYDQKNKSKTNIATIINHRNEQQIQSKIDKQLRKQRPRSKNSGNNNNYNTPSSDKYQKKRSSHSGIMAITVTQHHTDSYDDDKPATPSRSSQRNDGSETRESSADFEILQRDKDYRPSIVQDMSLVSIIITPIIALS